MTRSWWAWAAKAEPQVEPCGTSEFYHQSPSAAGWPKKIVELPAPLCYILPTLHQVGMDCSPQRKQGMVVLSLFGNPCIGERSALVRALGVRAGASVRARRAALNRPRLPVLPKLGVDGQNPVGEF